MPFGEFGITHHSLGDVVNITSAAITSLEYFLMLIVNFIHLGAEVILIFHLALL